MVNSNISEELFLHKNLDLMSYRPLTHLISSSNHYSIKLVLDEDNLLNGFQFSGNKGFKPFLVESRAQWVQPRLMNLFQTNFIYCENTEIFDAVRAGNTGLVKDWTQRKGSDLRKVDSDSWTALHWAVEYGHENLVMLLLDADPLLLHMKTKEGLSALSIAAWRGNVKMVKLLLEQGSDVNDRTQWGETPLHHAVSFNHLAVCQFLLSASADPHAMDKMERSPYKMAMQKGDKKMKQLFT